MLSWALPGGGCDNSNWCHITALGFLKIVNKIHILNFLVVVNIISSYHDRARVVSSEDDPRAPRDGYGGDQRQQEKQDRREATEPQPADVATL